MERRISPRRKTMLPIVKNYVFPWLLTVRYSQLRMAKKKAAHVRSAHAASKDANSYLPSSVEHASSQRWMRCLIVAADSRFSGGSRFFHAFLREDKKG